MMNFKWPKNSVFNILITLCVCVFMVYQMQETALDRMDDFNEDYVRPPILPFFRVMSAVEEDEIPEDKQEQSYNIDARKFDFDPADEIDVRSHTADPIWITMGLCWSANAKVYGKEKFPYTKAAPLSSQLWLKLTSAKVVMQIVYSEEEVSKELMEYKERLESFGTLVRLVHSGNMSCVLAAQLIRILAFTLPEINPNDIVVTADVDAFITSKDIVKPLRLPHKKIWLYRYELTYYSGATFMMPFIGARANTWKEILEYEGDLQAMVATYSAKMNFSTTYTWEIDQLIVSHAIMKSGYCSLPADNNVWKQVHLEPKVHYDKKTCWHGSGLYEDCNNKLWYRNSLIRYKGNRCKWWHFYPDEKYEALKAKFDEIMSGQAENGIVNKLIDSSKSIQKKLFGGLVFSPHL